MYTAKPPLPNRAGAVLAAALIVVAIGWGLLTALVWHRVDKIESAMAVFTVPPPAPPPSAEIIPDPKPSSAAESEAAPPNIRSKPVEIVAPPRVLPLPPPPVAAAPVADTGKDASAGAAAVPGPGTGAGGVGNGRGSGGSGNGTGGGLRAETPPYRVKGKLRFADAAKVADGDALIGRELTTEFFVEATGRVSGCRVTRSSGMAAVDAEVCRLIEERYRYEPARDGMGRPVRVAVKMDHSWHQRF